MSLAVTSSHRQAKHLPLRSLVTAGGTAVSGGAPAQLLERLAVLARARARVLVPEADRVRGLRAGHGAGALGVRERARAGHLARGVHPLGKRRGA